MSRLLSLLGPSGLDPCRDCAAVILARPAYQPGELVEGLVCLSLRSTCESSGLFVKFKGYETCTYQEAYQATVVDSNGHVRQVTKYRERSGRLDYFQRSVCVAGPGVYQPGQYQVPFCLSLPPDLQPSCHFEHKGFGVPTAERSSADVVYRLKATLYRRGLLRANLEGYAPVTVQVDHQGGARSTLQTTEIVTCGCFGRQPASAKFFLDSDVVAAGGTLRLAVDADNGSGRPFGTIKVALKRCCAFADTASSPAYDTWFVGTAASKSFAGFTAAEPQGRRVLEFQVPPDACPSISTDLFEAKYKVEVTLCTALASNLGATLPLTLKLLPSAALQQAAPPAVVPGWCPMQTHDRPVLLTVPGSAEVPDEVLRSDEHFWHDWASSPWVSGCIPPPPEVGYQVEEEEGDTFAARPSGPEGSPPLMKQGKGGAAAAPPPVAAPAPAYCGEGPGPVTPTGAAGGVRYGVAAA